MLAKEYVLSALLKLAVKEVCPFATLRFLKNVVASAFLTIST